MPEQREMPGEIKPRSFKEKLENFFYHYKWHVIVAAVLITVLVICIVQASRTETADYGIVYAGEEYITAVKRQEMAEFAEAVAGEGKCVLEATVIDQTEATGFTGQNLEWFDQQVMTGDLLIMLLSPAMYERVTEGRGALVPLDNYVGDSGAVYCDDSHTGVRLSSLDIYGTDAFSHLPEDTVVCLRSGYSLANVFDKKAAEQRFADHEALLRKLMEYAAD